MEEMAARKTSPRKVLTRLLANAGLEGSGLTDLARADTFVDESLHQLEHEEPSLLAWLRDDPEVNDLLKVHTSATYALLHRNSDQGRPLAYTMRQIDSLNYRLICTVAMAAAARERPRGMEMLDV